jgi:DNA-directed RNA polymerase specialized sigma24 family protein
LVELKVENRKVLTGGEVSATRALYDRYGNLLLGYIFRVVKDTKLAEEYLIEIFKEVPYHLNNLNSSGENTWLQLQTLAKRKLSGFAATMRSCSSKDFVKSDGSDTDKYVSVMSMEQRFVFCGVYYYQQSVASLAHELGKTEESVRMILREAFKIIRNG